MLLRSLSKAFATAALGVTLVAGGTVVTGLALPTAAHAQDAIKQVKLTPKMIEGFIGSQKDMAAIAQKLQNAGSEKPDPKMQEELDGAAKKHGFKDFNEYDDVAANISMVMAGIDPQSGQFSDPATAIRKEIEDVRADKTIPEKDKKQMLEELTEALKSTPPIQFPDNIELVKKFRAEIDKVLQ